MIGLIALDMVDKHMSQSLTTMISDPQSRNCALITKPVHSAAENSYTIVKYAMAFLGVTYFCCILWITDIIY